MIFSKIKYYLLLIRFDKPIGTFLVLWPTLWALWLSNYGFPNINVFLIFFIGCFFMRSAGCAINDFADRNIDQYVQRTKTRPIISGYVKPWEAILISIIFFVLSFLLIYVLNFYVKLLSILALGMTILYPFSKRFFILPQIILGVAFSLGIPMVYIQTQNTIPIEAYLLIVANIAWTIAYDTIYALIDKNDDIKIGIYTSAITFGRYHTLWISLCYAVCLLCFFFIYQILLLNNLFWFFWGIAGALSCYYILAITYIKDKKKYLKVFHRNNWFGLSIFLAFLFGLQ